MNEELCRVIAWSLFGGSVPAVTEEAGLLAALSRHAILALLCTGKREEKLPVSDKGKAQIRQSGLRQTAVYMTHCAAIEELVQILARYDTVPVILKGMAAAQYYPDPVFRSFGDIDFLVRGRLSAEEAAALLVENGFLLEKDREQRGELANPRHIGLEKNGIRFELHRYFSLGDSLYDRALDEQLQKAEPIQAKVGETRFSCMPPVENGMVLLEHIRHHLLSSGLGLRQIADWACYVDRILDDRLWTEGFSQVAEACGLRKLAVIVTSMCTQWLGAPARGFAAGADEETCCVLLENVVESGNFGRARDTAENKIASFTRSESVFARLQKGGLARWKAAWRYPMLRPFAWLWQSFRIMGELVRRKASVKSLQAGRKLADSQRELFRRLEI